MNANELRIGNYVYGPLNEICKVEQLGSTLNLGLVGYRETKDLLSYGQNGQKPIPLTEDWLIYFGAKRMNEFDFDFGKLRIRTKDDMFPKGRIFYNSWAIKDENLKYVHELQNLYFALTQTELHNIGGCL